MKTYAIVAAEPQETPPKGQEQQQAPCSWESLLLLGGIFVVFYFLLIRPQQKRRKQEEQRKKEMLDNLARNDHVMTIGGIHGVVTNVGEEEISIRIDDKSDARMRINRDAISKVIGEEDEEEGGGQESQS